MKTSVDTIFHLYIDGAVYVARNGKARMYKPTWSSWRRLQRAMTAQLGLGAHIMYGPSAWTFRRGATGGN
jgi:hypothetical protein